MTEAVRPVGIDFGHMRRRELRRAAVISGIAHSALALAFVYSPQTTISVPRGVVAVELVSAPASASQRPAAPATAQPVAPRPPPRREPKKVVLPAEPTEPKVMAKAVEKPKPRRKPVVAPPKPAPAAEQDLADVLAQLREETGENREPVAAPSAPTSTGPAGSPTGTPVSPEVLAWMKRTKIHVKRNWVIQPGFRTQMLETLVEVELDPSGALRSEPRVTRRSGNPWYDEGVVRAIRKSSPLPAPPEAGTWSFVFAPEDSY